MHQWRLVSQAYLSQNGYGEVGIDVLPPLCPRHQGVGYGGSRVPCDWTPDA